MSEVALTEQLDQAIDLMLRDPDGSAPIVEHQIARLVGMVAELRELTRTEFKARLRAELEREVSMSTARQSPEKREGVRAVIPYVVVSDVHQEIDFIKRVFGAEGRVYGLGSQGGFHSEYRIGDSPLMIGGGGKGSKWQGTPVPAGVHIYVENVDGAYPQGMEGGASSLMPPPDQGDGG